MGSDFRNVNIRDNINTEDLGLPKILYKYRDWKNERHKTAITKGEVYFASPRVFDDPKDCMNLLDYSLLTDKDIYNRYYKGAIQRNPRGTKTELHVFATAMVRKGFLRDESHINSVQKEYTEKFFDTFGVLSLTANFRLPKLWKKYSNERKGFCLGIDSNCFVNSDPEFGGGEINYYEELPKIHPDEKRLLSYVMQIYSKEEKWRFEQEFRLHKRWESEPSKKDRTSKIPKKCVKEIIFGADIEPEDKKEIKQIAKKNFPNIKFIQIYRYGEKPIR